MDETEALDVTHVESQAMMGWPGWRYPWVHALACDHVWAWLTGEQMADFVPPRFDLQEAIMGWSTDDAALRDPNPATFRALIG